MEQHVEAITSYGEYTRADPTFLVFMPHGRWAPVEGISQYIIDHQYGYYVKVKDPPTPVVASEHEPWQAVAVG